MAKKFMKILGTVLVLAGIAGFIFPFHGLLSLTMTHNVFHILTGVLALAVSGNNERSILFARFFGIVYLIVAVLGLFTRDVLGLIILEPLVTFIHFAIAILALVIGFKSVNSKSPGIQRNLH